MTIVMITLISIVIGVVAVVQVGISVNHVNTSADDYSIALK
jgi:hypothetical protein